MKAFVSTITACILCICTLGATDHLFFPPLRENSIHSYEHLFSSCSDFEVVTDKAEYGWPGHSSQRTLKLRLKNGLEVLLISDPKSSQSAAALSVNVGSWDNPSEAPGLAHFVEHLVFLGSEKYPSESDFCKYISERGGEYNAFTSHDKTVYGFSINHEGFEGGLDRFSRFFIDPLFSPTSLEKEKNAVHHEFEDHIDNDAVRIWRVLKETGNASHPNAIFSCGNLESLQNVNRDYIRNWYLENYQAQRMHLVIRSALSLKELVDVAVKKFLPIASGEQKKSQYQGPFTSEQQKGHTIYATPSHKNRSLLLIWEVPKNLYQGDNITSLQLCQLALDFEGPGSLSNYLMENNLAKGVTVDYWKVERDHLLFLIEVSLTKTGIQNIDDVKHLCFQTLKRLQVEGVPSYLHQQLYETQKLFGMSVDIDDPFSFVIETAGALVDHHLDLYPLDDRISSDYNKESVDQFTQFLSAKNCIFFVVAPEHELPEKMTKIERWMKTPYFIRSVDSEKLDLLDHANCNEYIIIRPEDHEPKEELENPWLDEEILPEVKTVIDHPNIRLHLAYTADASDSVTAFFCIRSSSMKLSIKNCALESILYENMIHHLQILYPSSKKCDVSWMLIPGDGEVYLFLKIEGDDKKRLFKDFFYNLMNLEMSQESFHSIKENIQDNDLGDPDPLDYAQAVAETYLTPGSFTHSDLVESIESLTFEEYLFFCKNFLKQSALEGIFYGSLDSDQVMEYWIEVKDLFEHHFFHSDRPNEHFKAADDFSDKLPKTVKKNTHRRGNAVVLVFDLGKITREKWVTQKVLSQLLQEEFFEELRTNQQIAYKLYTWTDSRSDHLLQFFGIQSSTHAPEDLMERVDTFVSSFVEKFHSVISKDRVNLIRHMLITMLKRQKQEVSGSDEARWIVASIEILKSMDYETLFHHCESFFSSRNYKKLKILIEGAKIESKNKD
jgi:insulysin